MRFISIILALVIASGTTTYAREEDWEENDVPTEDTNEQLAFKMFSSIPDDFMPALPLKLRFDMYDYYIAGSDKASNNIFGGECKVDTIGYRCISISAADALKYHIAAPSNDDNETVILITTYMTPTPDSRISFFKTYLSCDVLEGDLFEEPTLEDWLTKEGKQNIEDIENALPFIFATYEFDAETNLLTITNNFEQYLSKEDYAKMSSYFIPSITYKWTGKKMKKLK